MKMQELTRILVVVMAMIGTFTVIRIVLHEDQNTSPKVGGQTLPATAFELNFSKSYDIVLGGQWENREKSILHNVKFLGLLGSEGKGGGLGSSYYEPFRWLVLEQSDGRKIFLPSNEIRMIEEIGKSVGE